jgi:hypothetical protein
MAIMKGGGEEEEKSKGERLNNNTLSPSSIRPAFPFPRFTGRRFSLPGLHFERPQLRGLQILANNLATQIDKDLVHVCATTGGCLVVRRIAPALRERKGACARHGAVFFEIGFVADYDNGHFGVVLDADDLFADFGEFVERGHARDREDEEEALSLFHVQFSVILCQLVRSHSIAEDGITSWQL